VRQADGEAAAVSFRPKIVEDLCRLKRDVYADFSARYFHEFATGRGAGGARNLIGGAEADKERRKKYRVLRRFPTPCQMDGHLRLCSAVHHCSLTGSDRLVPSETSRKKSAQRAILAEAIPSPRASNGLNSP
jgi:hypothetical protein